MGWIKDGGKSDPMMTQINPTRQSIQTNNNHFAAAAAIKKEGQGRGREEGYGRCFTLRFFVQ